MVSLPMVIVFVVVISIMAIFMQTLTMTAAKQPQNSKIDTINRLDSQNGYVDVACSVSLWKRIGNTWVKR